MSDRADYLLSLVLSEDRMPALHAKWVGKLNTSHDTRLTLSNDQHVRAKAALSHIERMDPTPNKQYTGKLIDWYHKGQFRAEDAGRVSTAVSDFHGLKTRLKPEHAGPEVANPKDFSSYPSIHHLEGALKAAGPKDETPWTKTTASQRDEVSKGSKVVHDDDKLTVRQVDTHKAMKVLGSNTSWCVVPDKDTFDEYREQGPLYHVHEKHTGARKLFHFPSNQFMDEQDEPVDTKDYGTEHPVLKKLFHGHSYKDFNDPAEMDKKILAGHPVHKDVLTSAATSSTNSDVLHRVAKDHPADDWIPTQVAMNAHTSAKTLEHLHDTDHLRKNSTDNLVAGHPNTSSALLDRVANKHIGNYPKSDYILRQVAGHKNTSPAMLERLHDLAYGHHDTANRAAKLTQNPVTRDMLHAEAGQHTPLLSVVARNQNTPPHVLGKLLHNWDSINGGHLAPMGYQSVFRSVVENPNTSAEHLHRAFSLQHAVVPSERGTLHRALAGHPNADSEMLTKLHKYAPHDGGLAAAIAAHPNAPAQILASHIGNTKAHMHMAGNPKLSHDLMHKLVDYEVPHSKEAFYKAPHDQLNALYNLAKNPSAPTDVLHKLHGKAKELGIRAAQHGTTTQIENKLAEHPNADTHLLQKLSRGSLHRDNPAARRLKSMGVEPQW